MNLQLSKRTRPNLEISNITPLNLQTHPEPNPRNNVDFYPPLVEPNPKPCNFKPNSTIVESNYSTKSEKLKSLDKCNYYQLTLDGC